MRTTKRTFVVLAMTLFISFVTPPSRAEVSFDMFYSNLSPYGSWRVSAQYGRVWQPSVGVSTWNPYYDGHWEYADVGWTWVSDYPWGAIPYHYGTWINDPTFGWEWVPGYTWAPAWVVFRTGPDYIGWAPVAPAFSIGVSLGVDVPAPGAFLFVSTRDFSAPRIGSCAIPAGEARTLVTRTRIENNLIVQHNIVVNRGPDVRVVEAASGRKIHVTNVERLPRVAPFREVERSSLRIAPERAGQHVRAAEPMSAKHALPPSREIAAMTREPAHGLRRDSPTGNPRSIDRAHQPELRMQQPELRTSRPDRRTQQPQGRPQQTPKKQKGNEPKGHGDR